MEYLFGVSCNEREHGDLFSKVCLFNKVLQEPG